MTQLWIPPRLWADDDCWIIGGGPSMPRQFGVPEDIVQAVMHGERYATAYVPYLEPIRDQHVIGINNAHMLGEWISFVFFGDYNWYLPHKLVLAEYSSAKVSCAARFGEMRYEGVKYMSKNLKKHKGICETPGQVSWNGNSGIAALSLAYQLGARRVFLLGFDMRLDENNVSHWHGSHTIDEISGKTKVAMNPKRHLAAFDRHTVSIPEVVADAKRLKLEIVNVNPESAINAFPKIKLSQIL